MLKLYNTPQRRLEEFKPQTDGRVLLYTCGPTVYNNLHVGNWVAYIRWDILVRTLKLHGYNVVRVMNITDVGHLISDADEGEDKIQKGARREGVSMYDVAQRYTDAFLRGMHQLGLLMPQHITKATEFIDEQIELIKRLDEKGYTYVIDDGVYFDTSKFPAYGAFARLDLDGLKAGARVGVVEGKRNVSDFALWKFDREGNRTEMVWDSQWGRGFPGWHLECSAMAMAKLGETIDIHTGGIDHIPVHHTNEIAQSEAATGKIFAHYWLHANFLTVNGTKISKSLDNGYTLEDIVQKGYSTEAFKMFVLQSHYRTESNFTWRNIESAQNRLNNWRAVAALRHQTTKVASSGRVIDPLRVRIDVITALNDDLSTPHALSAAERALSAYSDAAPLSPESVDDLNDILMTIDEVLGLNLINSTPDVPAEVVKLMEKRVAARASADWATSDKLRDELRTRNIGLNDTPKGQLWYYLR